jgi:SAM-dependent methyltransferase
MDATSPTLQLGVSDFQTLLERFGPSLALWRAAEIAVLRDEHYEPPVLDLGCGDGIVTSLVLRHVDIGVDPSADAIRRAATLSTYRRLDQRPVEAADVADGSIGTIMSNSVLEHIPDLDRVLRAAARLLRPDGTLVFTVPTEAFSRWLTLPLHRYARWRNAHYEHHNLWPTERWRAHLDAAGFDVQRVRPYLRREMVIAWDALELLQRVRLGQRPLFSLCWKRLPGPLLARLARRAARLDLSAPAPGGGRLIVARKRAMPMLHQ